MIPDRARLLNRDKLSGRVHDIRGECVVYWMSREQRVNDNWGVIFAANLANEKGLRLKVVFCLADGFLGATLRQYDFMLRGLKQVEEGLRKKNIPFELLNGDPVKAIPEFIDKSKAGYLVTDFDPLKIKRQWKKGVFEKISIPFYDVDGHNVIPVWVTSQKEEFAAYTIRPKILKLLPQYLDEYPELPTFPEVNAGKKRAGTDWEGVIKDIKVNRDVKPVEGIEPGEDGAVKMLEEFIGKRMECYGTERNDPNKDCLSGLSPYLHFGQISAQRIALEVNKTGVNDEGSKGFLEELIVRKELADNFCYYNKNYDSFEGFKDWGKETLNKHRKDKRVFLYSRDEFEEARTDDALWNAAQNQMKIEGKMHSYMRMYWAKKILEWTDSPEAAIEIAIYLNDKYELDGRDPNGYCGIAWSIGGIHDRAWFERKIFGKIRYMNYNGCARKFDVKAFEKRYNLENKPE